jgi:hypothetical protein
MDVSMPNLKKAKINIFFGIMVILVIFNILALKSAVLGLILGILWLFLFVSGIFGAKFAPGKSNLAKNMGGLFGAVILIICLSCLFFYLF